MATVVLVHGIGQQHSSAARLEAEWLPVLAEGVAGAGYGDVARRLWQERGGADGIRARMAFYGDVFGQPGAQGVTPDELTPEQQALAEALAQEWLARAATRAASAQDRQTAQRELAALRGEAGREAAGPLATLRPTVRRLSRISWLTPHGMAFAERFLYPALAQVRRYLTDERRSGRQRWRAYWSWSGQKRAC